MERKVIVGRIDGKEISRVIDYYQSNIPEQILTEKKNIRRQFEEQGYNGDVVSFEEK